MRIEVLNKPIVLVCSNCQNKIPPTGGLTQTKLIFSQFYRLEVPEQGSTFGFSRELTFQLVNSSLLSVSSHDFSSFPLCVESENELWYLLPFLKRIPVLIDQFSTIINSFNIYYLNHTITTWEHNKATKISLQIASYHIEKYLL